MEQAPSSAISTTFPAAVLATEQDVDVDPDDAFYLAQEAQRRREEAFTCQLPAFCCCLLPWVRMCCPRSVANRIAFGPRRRGANSSSDDGREQEQELGVAVFGRENAASRRSARRSQAASSTETTPAWTRYGQIHVYKNTIFIGPNWGFTLFLFCLICGLAYNFYFGVMVSRYANMDYSDVSKQCIALRL